MQKIALLISLLLPLASHGQDWKALISEFEQYAEESRIACQAVGASVAIVKDGKMIYAKGFGERSITDKQPVTPETLFQIGSMTKSFTSALTAVAVDRKALKWDDPVIQWLPSFLLYDPWVTRAFQVEDLYAQYSGLVPHVGDKQGLLGVSVDQMISKLRYFEPVTSFRTTFAYQNIFFSIGAEVLENATGKSWDKQLQEIFFQPLGMTSSSADFPTYLKTPNRVGWHQALPNNSILPISETIESADIIYIYAAAGGINSTALDMAKWIIVQADQGMYQGKQIISKENLERTHHPHVYAFSKYDSDYFYCLGWGMQEYSPYPIISHNGGTLGASNNMAIIPQERLGIVVLCNTRETVLAEALTMKFFDLYFGKSETDWTKKLGDDLKELQKVELAKNVTVKDPLPPLPLIDYTGTYFNPVYGDLAISARGNDLVGVIGPRKTQWVLKHYNRDTFSLWWAPLEDGTSKVLFYMDAQNKPNQVFLETLAGEKQGLFERRVD